MELTQKQEQYIVRYLHAVSEAIGDKLTSVQCDKALARLRSRIDYQLESLQKRVIEDVNVLDVLRGMGAPDRQAMILVRVWSGDEKREPGQTQQKMSVSSTQDHISYRPSDKDTDSTTVVEQPMQHADAPVSKSSERKEKTFAVSVWLGVCAYFGKTLDLPVWALRVFTILLAIPAAPVIFILYMALYLWLRATDKLPAVQPLRITRIILRPISVALSVIVIFLIGKYAVKAITTAYEIWLEKTPPDIGEWAWLESTDIKLLFLTLLFLIPLSLLSAMPLNNDWDYSLKRLTQACVALYAILTSFGIASYISGIIILFVREFTG